MKIIKNGKRNYGEFKFKCNKCGCKFEADVSDYIFIERDSNFQYHPTENNTPSDTISCKCPNCDKNVTKSIYDGIDVSISKFLTGGFTLTTSTLAIINSAMVRDVCKPIAIINLIWFVISAIATMATCVSDD